MTPEFNYCPQCGQNTIYEDFKHHLTCHHCNYEEYINPKPTAGCILRNKQGQIGLSIRGKDPHKGTYDIVGGFINPEEEAEEAMVREIKEEINLTIDSARLQYFSSKHSYYQYKDWMYYTIAFIFELQLEDWEVEQIVAGDDVAALKWFDIDKLPWDNMALIDVIFPLKKYISKMS